MLRICLSLTVVLAVLAAASARAADTGPLDANTMKVALHTATPQEDGFIDHVLALVQQDKLPLDLVQSTFLWAKKKPHKKFYYFKQGLIQRAADRGIKV
jgi:hypothetical protein